MWKTIALRWLRRTHAHGVADRLTLQRHDVSALCPVRLTLWLATCLTSPITNGLSPSIQGCWSSLRKEHYEEEDGLAIIRPVLDGSDK